MWQLPYQFNRAALEPWRMAARAGALLFNHPFNPLAYTLVGQSACLFCRALDRLLGSVGPEGFDMNAVHAFHHDLASEAQAHRFTATILPFVPRAGAAR